MTNALTRKLELFGALSVDDKDLLDAIVARPRMVNPRQDIIREGDKPSSVHLVLSGFAYRYKVLPDGSRSILAYLVPGDFNDLHASIFRAMDHNIATLSTCMIVDISREYVLKMSERPAILSALQWTALVDQAISREWLVNIGRRDAGESIAHLFCELHLRLTSVGLIKGGELELPIKQGDLGDTLGLSTVHVNRVLQAMRTSGLIVLKKGRLVIPEVDRLRAACHFNPNYLHLERERVEDVAPAFPTKTFS